MKIIAFDKIKLAPEEMGKITPLLQAEAKHAWELYKEGKFRELYFRADHPGAVIVLECENVDEAKKLMEDLPLVKAGYIEFEYIPVGPFTPFEGLFAK
jgi:hypothetical protein